MGSRDARGSGLPWSAVVGLGYTCGAFLAVAMAAAIQLLLTFDYCRHGAGRDLGRGADGVPRVALGEFPVVRCDTGAGTLELPISGTLVVLLFAATGIVASLLTLVVLLRRGRRLQVQGAPAP